MTSLALAMAISLVLGEADSRPRPGGRDASWDARNSARARAGLLPRKPPPKAPAVFRDGKRIFRMAAPKPTVLGEPGTLVEGPVDPAHGELRLAARSVSIDVSLSMQFDR